MCNIRVLYNNICDINFYDLGNNYLFWNIYYICSLFSSNINPFVKLFLLTFFVLYSMFLLSTKLKTTSVHLRRKLLNLEPVLFEVTR